MEKLKTYGLALALCGSFAQVAVADTRLDVSFNKTHYFTGPFASRFDGGDLDVELSDGNYVWQTCFGQGGTPFPQGIDPIYCPLGSTGFIAAGDVNDDGVQDSLTYWSIVGPVPAVIIEPFRPEEVALIARPSRLLPLLQNFRDVSIIIYYNLMDPSTFQQYNISQYSVIRDYAGAPETQPAGRGALTQMNQELVAGQYIFQFPRLKADPSQPDSVIPLGLNITPAVEALDPTTRYATGFRFTSGSWDNGYYQMDPRTTTVIKWVGNTRDLIRTGDNIYFAIYDTNGLIQYPSSYPYPVDHFALLSSPAVTSYTMPPLFFAAGQEEEMRFEFRRFAPTTTIAYDTSLRRFRAKLRMVDSFKGFAALNFPSGSSAVKTKATADFDGDGVNNITEFAAEYPTLEQISLEANLENALFVAGDDSMTDPKSRKVVGLDYRAQSPPGLNLPPVQNKLVFTGLDKSVKIDDDGYAVCLVRKRPFSGTSLLPTFSIQVPSAAAIPRFQKIVPGKDWILSEVVGDLPVETTVSAYTAVTHLLTGTVDPKAIQTFTVTLTPTYWQLKSAQPVADPTVLPNFQVTVADNPLK